RGGSDLERCLSSLGAQLDAATEVIVVDNASPGPLPSVAPPGFPGLTVLRNEENLGFVGASNQGIGASSGELILLLNDDTELEPGALAALTDTLRRNPRWAACQAKLLLMEDPTRLDTARSLLTANGFLMLLEALEATPRV